MDHVKHIAGKALDELADFAEDSPVLTIMFFIFGTMLIGAILASTFGERIQ